MSKNHDDDSECCDCECDCFDDFPSMPMIGEPAPAFKAKTSMGEVNFPADYKGKWVILFSHPADFTPVCTTEISTFAAMRKDFEELNTAVIGLSVDSVHSHKAWLRDIDELKWAGPDTKVWFPIIDDLGMEVSWKYGMIHPAMSDTSAVRSVFFIDPNGILRAMIYYPQSLGRNFQEIKRVIMALQKADADKCTTPADWVPGKDVIVPGAEVAAKTRDEVKDGELYSPRWYLTFRREGPGSAKKPAAKKKAPAKKKQRSQRNRRAYGPSLFL